MKKEVGLWIDHQKAVIVTLSGGDVEIKEIPSNIDKHERYDGDTPHKIADDVVDRHYAGHLKEYYDNIISTIRDAESILIMGPGEAKGELRKRFESEGLGGCIAGIETVDRMTDRQIAVKVRQHYSGIN